MVSKRYNYNNYNLFHFHVYRRKYIFFRYKYLRYLYNCSPYRVLFFKMMNNSPETRIFLVIQCVSIILVIFRSYSKSKKNGDTDTP